MRYGPFLRALRGAWWEIITDTYTSWREHRTIRLGAGLAYYGLFAVVPLLSISVALAGFVLDGVDVEEAVASALGDMVDGDATEIAAAISASIDTSSVAYSLGLLGLASLLLAASLVFVALQDALDTVWEVPYRSGAANTLRRRALSFVVVLLSGAVLVASFAVGALSSLVRNLAPGDTFLLEATADMLGIAGSLALMALVLAALFNYLTSANVHWPPALLGGVATAAVLGVGNRLVAEYLSRFGASSLAGAAGSVLVVLIWIYAIAQVVLVGAEITRTLELTAGAALDSDRGNEGD
jgi:membrane protein